MHAPQPTVHMLVHHSIITSILVPFWYCVWSLFPLLLPYLDVCILPILDRCVDVVQNVCDAADTQ